MLEITITPEVKQQKDTLAFGYVIPAIRAYSGLAPVRQCSCRAYNTSSTCQIRKT